MEKGAKLSEIDSPTLRLNFKAAMADRRAIDQQKQGLSEENIMYFARETIRENGGSENKGIFSFSAMSLLKDSRFHTKSVRKIRGILFDKEVSCRTGHRMNGLTIFQ